MNNTEASLYDHVNKLLAGHEKLLSDTYRNQLFYQALQQNVTSESCVLDIGSGTGVWAIAAACLGAKRVVAVEQDHLLTGLIKALAQANGVANRVEVVQGDALQLELNREFDIVVSETIGHVIFDEQIVPLMIRARERFLKPDGVLIPQAVTLVAAPAQLANQPKLPAGIPVTYDYFEALRLHRPLGLTDRADLRLTHEPQALIHADLTSIKAVPDLSNLTARWELPAINQINCFAVWAELNLASGVKMETINTTSWTPMIYRLGPFKQEQGALEFKLTLTSTCNYWTVTLTTPQSQEVQSYSPASAATVLLARARTDVDLLSHLQRIGQTP